MQAMIKKWLAMPRFFSDEEEQRRANLLNTIVNGSLAFILLIILANLTDSGTPPRNYVIDLVMLLFFLLIRRELHRGRVFLVGVVMMVSAFGGILLAVASEGTIFAPSTLSFLLLVVISGLVFKFRGILYSTIACSAAIFVVIVAQNTGRLPSPPKSLTLVDWFVTTLNFAMAGGLTYYAQKSSLEALQRSRLEIKQREQAESELLKLTRAVEQSPASIVITDLLGNIEYINPHFTKTTGYTAPEALGKNPRILKTQFTPPEMYQQLWKTISAGDEWRGNFVNRKKDGSLYNESAVISPIKGPDGSITNYLAVKEDISERMHAESTLRASETKYRILADNTFDWEFWSAPDGKYLYVSPACFSVTGYTAEEITNTLGLTHQIVHPQDLPLLDRHNELAAQRQKGEVDFRIIHRDGSVRWISHACQPVFDEQGNYLGVRGTNRDITTRKQAEQALEQANEKLKIQLGVVNELKDKLREQSVRDPLTGLYNRRYLDEALPREINRAGRKGTSLSIIIMDIDHFKNINDTYGHLAGDQFIKVIANLLISAARASDIACRFGGEEFLMVLPGMDSDHALNRAEEIRVKCEEEGLSHIGHENSLTMSFGVATYPEHGLEVDDLLIRADDALYQSKQNGRNRVTLWQPQP